MKIITLLFLSCLYSICSIAQQVQISPTFDDKEKVLYFTFNNTTDQQIAIPQSAGVEGGTFVEIIFLNKVHKEIARRVSVYSNDRTIILQPKETKKAPISLSVFGHTNIAKVEIKYHVISYIGGASNRERLRESIVFDWGD